MKLKGLKTKRKQNVDILFAVKELQDACRKESGNKKRMELLGECLRKNKQLEAVLSFVYNPYVRFHLTSKDISEGELAHGDRCTSSVFWRTAKDYHVSKKSTPFWIPYSSPFLEMLNLLRQRIVTGNAAKKLFISSCCAVPYVLFPTALNILDKDLKIGLGIKSVNQVLRDYGKPLIPEFNVSLGEKIALNEAVDWSVGWYASRKFDGLRCLCNVSVSKEYEGAKANKQHHKNGIETGSRVQINFFSRKGNPIHTLEPVKKDLLARIEKAVAENKLPFDNFWLDGEITTNASEDMFTSVVSNVKRAKAKWTKDTYPVFHVFDIISDNIFQAQKGEVTFKERLSVLKAFLNEDSKHVCRVQQIPVYDVEHIARIHARHDRRGHEGIVLRRMASFYAGKRTRDLLKVKSWNDSEYKIMSLNYGDKQFREDGEIKTFKNIVTSFTINHKGNPVSVGSGLSKEDCIDAAKHPRKYIGQIVTVKYFEESKDKDGTLSLRFPIIKQIHFYNPVDAE